MKRFLMFVLIGIFVISFSGGVFAVDCDGLNLLMHFNNDSSVGEIYNNSNGTVVYDYSGNLNNGTGYFGANGEGVWNSSGGKFSGAFEFDGKGDYIKVGDDVSIQNMPSFSYSAWVKQASFVDGAPIMIKSERSFMKSTGGGHYIKCLRAGITTNAIVYSNVNAIDDGKWHHIVCVFNNSGDNNLTMYIDSVVFNNFQTTLTGGLLSDAGSVDIGSSPVLGRSFNGSIDEVAIWNRSLSATEILDLYNSGIPIFCGTTDTTPPLCSSPSPTTNLSSGTTQTYINLTTDENANCRYSTTSGVSYPSMADTFSTTGGTAHSTLVTGLGDGQTYNFYVRCNDTFGNYNTNDFLISFSVESASTTCSSADADLSGVVDIIELMEWRC